MATTTAKAPSDGTPLIDAIQSAEDKTLEAVRTFVDTVDGAFPDGEDAPRRKIIDAAFHMVEQLVGASNDLARNVVKATEDGLRDVKASASSAN